jgi:hypothetical protein
VGDREALTTERKDCGGMTGDVAQKRNGARSASVSVSGREPTP